MAIQTTVGEQKTQKEIPFPKLMKNTRTELMVVLFKNPGKGVHLAGEVAGEYSEGILMDFFIDVPVNECITLQNTQP